MNQKNIPGTYALKGGTNAWKTAGYPMEGTNVNGAPPKPAEPAQNPVPNPGTTDTKPNNY